MGASAVAGRVGLFLPPFWVSAFYPIPWAWLAPLIGFIWLLGRIVYLRGYMADPNKRLIGAMLGGLTGMIMLIIAAAGVVQAI
ncbi:MAG TPA: MAPEG family protein [Steroidobacteraceae bacterium]